MGSSPDSPSLWESGYARLAKSRIWYIAAPLTSPKLFSSIPRRWSCRISICSSTLECTRVPRYTVSWTCPTVSPKHKYSEHTNSSCEIASIRVNKSSNYNLHRWRRISRSTLGRASHATTRSFRWHNILQARKAEAALPVNDRSTYGIWARSFQFWCPIIKNYNSIST